MQASDKKQALIIAKLQDSNNDYGSVAFRVQNINGEHRIRSVILMEQKQVDLKVENAKKLGEPIFPFLVSGKGSYALRLSQVVAGLTNPAFSFLALLL